MGLYFYDKYSLLHMLSGIIAYFLGLDLKYWILLHFLFEITENSDCGMLIINNYLKLIWSGGKEQKDSFINSFFGDNFFAILGWTIAYYFSKQ
jgi:hypothetical protein